MFAVSVMVYIFRLLRWKIKENELNKFTQFVLRKSTSRACFVLLME